MTGGGVVPVGHAVSGGRAVPVVESAETVDDPLQGGRVVVEGDRGGGGWYGCRRAGRQRRGAVGGDCRRCRGRELCPHHLSSGPTRVPGPSQAHRVHQHEPAPAFLVRMRHGEDWWNRAGVPHLHRQHRVADGQSQRHAIVRAAGLHGVGGQLARDEFGQVDGVRVDRPGRECADRARAGIGNSGNDRREVRHGYPDRR
nr:hypothetical protein [Frankia sp. Cj3]